MIVRATSVLATVCAVVLAANRAPGDEAPRTGPLFEFERRREVFEFTEKPTVTRAGDTVTIGFAVKDFCDATVAIEDSRGRIARHLASGVLGANAPAPFGKDSLKQTVVWDGKNDKGEYVDDKDSHTVRVSLGLKPRFERTLFWSPKKRVPSPRYLRDNVVLAAAPGGGAYVYDGGNGNHIRLFDSAGEYVRTVYPPPANRLKDMQGLKWHTFPQDGQTWPLKADRQQSTFLPDHARSMAVHGDRLALAQTAGTRLTQLAADGGTGGLPIEGPAVSVPVHVPGSHEWRGGIVNVPPSDMAFSPDGKWIYVTGYMWTRAWRDGMLCGVGRVAADGDGPLENFAGSLGEVKGIGGHGSGHVEPDFVKNLKGNPPVQGELAAAASVATDAQGRVYAADHLNDRLRVYDPDGKHLKDIPVARPALVRIHPGNGQIYVFSYALPLGHNMASVSQPMLTRLGDFGDPRKLASMPLPATPGVAHNSPVCNLAVDFHADPPVIWIGDRATSGYSGLRHPERTFVKLLVERDGKLVVQRDFFEDARREVVYTRGTRHMKQRLYFDPKHRRLYVGELVCPHPEHVTTMRDGAKINPDNGQIEVFSLPADAEDMAFDMDGHAYLRGFDKIMRYDAATWREVPFDYGEELESGGTFFGGRRVSSAITFFSTRGLASGQMGGLGVSPRGHIIVGASNPAQAADRRAEKVMHHASVKAYTPQMFPGRHHYWEVHVFDRHGRRLYEDAIPGIGRHVGLNMDADDNLYAMLAAVGPVNGRPYFNPITGSLIKVRPGTKILATAASLALTDALRPNRPPDLTQVDGGGSAWLDEGAFWARGGVGMDGKRSSAAACHCPSQSRPAFDFFARSFLPETDRYSVLVIDKNNNEIARIGQYGNVDDGLPLIKDGGPPNPRSIGGDEVALMRHQFLATETDRRLFIGDLGNARIVSVRLDYHAEEKVALKDVPDEGKKVL